MKGYFCTKCGKEVPSTIKDGRMWFYCSCNGQYKNVAYFREIDNNDCYNKTESDNEIEIHDTIHVNYFKANEIIKLYLSKNVFISKVVENTHLDIDMVSNVLHDLFEYNGD